MKPIYTIEISSTDYETNAFSDWLNKHGHTASVIDGDRSVDGVTTVSDAASSAIYYKLWSKYCDSI